MKTRKFETGDMVEEPVAKRVTLPESTQRINRAEDEHEEEIRRNRAEARNNPYVGGVQNWEKAAVRNKVAPQMASTPDSGDMGARSKKMVTADEVAKSGFTNLRDYLNAKQGLSRKGEPASGPSDRAQKNVDAALMGLAVINKDKAKAKYNNMASGGSVSSRADGIAQRGKTRGKMC